ncbi:hypothetical protein [Alysiella filiformis]|uniref:Uncharacterized protein n=1 Tax=Alysiella filiformis DSM 16848 TaxID=1120981 RepID=A0A286E493_9NEIS|nr:hypothetical protein [Alysiella filiformis]QMT30998.1 hypothetical protein H3L97_09755 [Alysiella filiformis]UBQ56014.1 hypothetical protein JF568_10715 [Alysiella filiformis DSM 16848]SOD65722.1 hypothetical protein SAMN02746062_00399 [Alysiella filiformis DSM 16848]
MNSMEKIKHLTTLLGNWGIIAILYWGAMQPKSLAGVMKLFAMFTMFWTIFAAIFSVIAFFKILFGKYDKSLQFILLLTIGIWLFWAVFANI